MIKFPNKKKTLIAMLLSLAMVVEGGGSLLYASQDQELLTPESNDSVISETKIDEAVTDTDQAETNDVAETDADRAETNNVAVTDADQVEETGHHVFRDLPDDGLTAPDVDAYMSAERETKGIRIQELTEEDVQGSSADDSYYSSVDKGYVSDVIDQADSQLCWAFSAASCMEINAVKKGLMSDDEHLSADALAYYFFNRVTDKKGLTADTVIKNTAHGASSYYDNGGNSINAAFELMQWLNPISYDKAPFTGEPNEYPADVSFAYDQDVVHVNKVTWTASSSERAIKQMVYDQGAAAIGVYMKESAVKTVSYNGASVDTLFSDSRESINHSVTIVGWDDEIPAELFSGSSYSNIRPSRDGAWICKNSYDDHPYFYLSFDDASILSSSYNNKAISFSVDKNNDYDNNYGYDGGVGTYRSAAPGIIYGAQIFCAAAESAGTDTAAPDAAPMAEEIKAVSFATNTPGAFYTVSVYTDLPSDSSDPTDGILMSQVSNEVSLLYPGYYTVQLPKSVYVDEGVYFSIVVSVRAPGSASQATLMYDEAYGGSLSSWVYSNPGAKAGRSFLSADGEKWVDSATADLSDFTDKDAGHTPGTGYVRIKAYTDNTAVTGMHVIDNDMVALVPDQVYTGLQITPDPTVYYGTKRLKKDRDYLVTYGANTAVGKGTGTLTVTGTGRYITASSIVRSFNITKASIADPDVIVNGTENPLSFTGNNLTPLTLSFNGIELRQNRDYTIKYSRNNKPGVASAVIKGKGNFVGKRKEVFMIDVLDINDPGITIKDIKPQDYKGELIEPEVTILNQYDHKAPLVKDVDYTVEYFKNLMPGQAYAMVTGTGSYTGVRRIDFTIEGADLSNATVSKVNDVTYCGDAVTPEVEVYYGAKKLVESVDYEVTYSNNIDVGVAYINITGRKGTIYSGTGITRTFNIRAANIANSVLENFGDVAYVPGTKTYTQNEDFSDPNCMKIRLNSGYYLKEGDYAVSYQDNVSSGLTKTATMTITAKSDNLTGTIVRTFDIISGTKVVLGDFTNKKLTVTGMNSSRQYIYDASNHRSNADNSVKPTVTVSYKGVTLTKGVDYDIKYHNNNGIGMAYLTIEAVNGSEYIGVRTEYYEIIGKPIYVTALGVPDNDFIVTEPVDCVYTGAPRCPEVVIRENVLVDKDEKNKTGKTMKYLQPDRDYTLKYHRNVDAGKAYVTMEGMGEYSGKHTFYFNIDSADLSQAKHPSIAPKMYAASKICPELYPQNEGGYLREGVDYEVSYGENINAGVGTVVFTAPQMTQEELNAGLKPNYVGQLTVSFTIKPRPMNDGAISVEGLDARRYEGTRVTPLVSLYLTTNEGVLLIPESEYEVSYGNNSKAGRGSVTVKARSTSSGGTGNYSGSRVCSFDIAGAHFNLTDDLLSGYTVPYTGKKAKLSIPSFDCVSGNLVQKTDYLIKTDKRRDVGEGIFTLIGKGTYKGTVEYGNYDIIPRSVDEAEIEFKNLKDVVYTPGHPAKCDKLKVKAGKKKLVKGRDYVVTYYNNDQKGTATIVVTLVNNYSGSRSVTFNIV